MYLHRQHNLPIKQRIIDGNNTICMQLSNLDQPQSSKSQSTTGIKILSNNIIGDLITNSVLINLLPRLHSCISIGFKLQKNCWNISVSSKLCCSSSEGIFEIQPPLLVITCRLHGHREGSISIPGVLFVFFFSLRSILTAQGTFHQVLVDNNHHNVDPIYNQDNYKTAHTQNTCQR